MNARQLFTLLGAVALLSSCGGAEPASDDHYRPAKLEPLAGSDRKRVTLTSEGAARTGLAMAAVSRSGAHLVVPYEALLYDGQGESFVYSSSAPLTFVRTAVVVDRVDGDRVLLMEGPAPGTDVVTTGASEVYGTELEIAGGH